MLEIIVYGSPAPQGSKRFVGLSGKGHAKLIESSKAVKPWREAVKQAALGALFHGAVSLDGPLHVTMSFTLRKPTSAPRSRRTWPDRKPDLSKLVRSTEDALTDAGVWRDDAQVVQCWSNKTYPGEGVNALNSPGAVIRIVKCEEALPSSTACWSRSG